MLPIYFMQQWYGLSDPAMEDSLYDVESMRRFAGVDLDHIPDETTICKFRHFLERHQLTAALFRRTEIGSTKKGTSWYFCLKAHVGSDPQGRVHSAVVTSAPVHDSEIMEDCVHGAEEVIYGDKAYVSAARQQQAESDGVEWRVLRKENRGRRLNCADRSFNTKSNRVRARVEHVFGVIKRLWGYERCAIGAWPRTPHRCLPCLRWPTFIWRVMSWSRRREPSARIVRSRSKIDKVGMKQSHFLHI